MKFLCRWITVEWVLFWSAHHEVSKIKDVACAPSIEFDVDQRVHYGLISSQEEPARSQVPEDVISKSAYSIDESYNKLCWPTKNNYAAYTFNSNDGIISLCPSYQLGRANRRWHLNKQCKPNKIYAKSEHYWLALTWNKHVSLRSDRRTFCPQVACWAKHSAALNQILSTMSPIDNLKYWLE